MLDYNKFPSVLKKELENGSVAFPIDMQISFTPQYVYRGIKREHEIEENEKITMNDFKSYAELGKRVRGMQKNISYYSCSFFDSMTPIEVAFKLPKPNKAIIGGYVRDSYGTLYKKENHIDLWLYDEVSFENEFAVIKRGD